jgi:hypothetical protein
MGGSTCGIFVFVFFVFLGGDGAFCWGLDGVDSIGIV